MFQRKWKNQSSRIMNAIKRRFVSGTSLVPKQSKNIIGSITYGTNRISRKNPQSGDDRTLNVPETLNVSHSLGIE